MNKTKVTLFLLFSMFFGTHLAQGQWLVGPAGGVAITEVYFENINAATSYSVSPVMGIMGTYLPDRKKPGVKLIASKYQYSFYEYTVNTTEIHYTNDGFNFQFLSYLYLPVKKFRISIEAGPSVNYFNNPEVSPGQAESSLPVFASGNISKLMLDLTGGIGLAQPIGRVHLSAHSSFSFSTTKIFNNYIGASNPLSLQFWFAVQYQIGKKKK